MLHLALTMILRQIKTFIKYVASIFQHAPRIQILIFPFLQTITMKIDYSDFPNKYEILFIFFQLYQSLTMLSPMYFLLYSLDP